MPVTLTLKSLRPRPVVYLYCPVIDRRNHLQNCITTTSVLNLSTHAPLQARIINIKWKKEKFTLSGIETNFFNKLIKRIDKVVTEDLSDFDPQAEYDTRVKLPEWQVAKLKAYASKKAGGNDGAKK